MKEQGSRPPEVLAFRPFARVRVGVASLVAAAVTASGCSAGVAPSLPGGTDTPSPRPVETGAPLVPGETGAETETQLMNYLNGDERNKNIEQFTGTLAQRILEDMDAGTFGPIETTYRERGETDRGQDGYVELGNSPTRNQPEIIMVLKRVNGKFVITDVPYLAVRPSEQSVKSDPKAIGSEIIAPGWTSQMGFQNLHKGYATVVTYDGMVYAVDRENAEDPTADVTTAPYHIVYWQDNLGGCDVA